MKSFSIENRKPAIFIIHNFLFFFTFVQSSAIYCFQQENPFNFQEAIYLLAFVEPGVRVRVCDTSPPVSIGNDRYPELMWESQNQGIWDSSASETGRYLLRVSNRERPHCTGIFTQKGDFYHALEARKNLIKGRHPIEPGTLLLRLAEPQQEKPLSPALASPQASGHGEGNLFNPNFFTDFFYQPFPPRPGFPFPHTGKSMLNAPGVYSTLINWLHRVQWLFPFPATNDHPVLLIDTDHGYDPVALYQDDMVWLAKHMYDPDFAENLKVRLNRTLHLSVASWFQYSARGAKKLAMAHLRALLEGISSTLSHTRFHNHYSSPEAEGQIAKVLTQVYSTDLDLYADVADPVVCPNGKDQPASQPAANEGTSETSDSHSPQRSIFQGQGSQQSSDDRRREDSPLRHIHTGPSCPHPDCHNNPCRCSDCLTEKTPTEKHTSWQPDIPESMVDMLVESAEQGITSSVEDLIKIYGLLILLKVSSCYDTTALHAAIAADQDRVVNCIITYAGCLMPKLMNLQNSKGDKPLDMMPSVLLYLKDLIPQLKCFMEAYDPQLDYIELIKAEAEAEAKAEQELIPVKAKPQKKHDILLKVYQKKIEDDYSDTTVQQTSDGRYNCFSHPDFHHAMIPLHNCLAGGQWIYICDAQLISLLYKIFDDDQSADNTFCLHCNQPIRFSILIESARAHLRNEQDEFRKLHVPDTLKLLTELNSFLWENRLIRYSYMDCVKEAGIQTCDLCLQDDAECHRFNHVSCGHRFCLDCLTEYIAAGARSKDSLFRGYLACPGVDCEVSIPDTVIQHLAGDKVVRQKNQILLQIMVLNNRNLFMCLAPDCDNIFDLSDIGCCTRVVCDQCHKDSCIECNVSPFHTGLTCEAYQSRFTSEGAEKYFRRAKAANPNLYGSCPNPKCGIEIFKEAGCNLITCKHCTRSFCWLCQKDLTDEKYSHYQDPKNPCTITGLKQAAPPREPMPQALGLHRLRERGAAQQQEKCNLCRTTGRQLTQWFCLHAFCPDCEHAMIDRASKKNHELAGWCLECNPISATAVTLPRQLHDRTRR